MMKTFSVLAALLLGTLAAHAQSPGNDAAPLGLELGKTQCARLSSPANHVRTGRSPWAGGDTVEIKNLDRFHLTGLTRVTVNCDAHDTVALVTLTFDRLAFDEVSKKLNERYVSRRKTEQNAQNAYAEWEAANGSSVEMLYARDSKQFTVAYWAKGAKNRYFAYSGNGAATTRTPTAKPAAQTAPPQPAPL